MSPRLTVSWDPSSNSTCRGAVLRGGVVAPLARPILAKVPHPRSPPLARREGCWSCWLPSSLPEQGQGEGCEKERQRDLAAGERACGPGAAGASPPRRHTGPRPPFCSHGKNLTTAVTKEENQRRPPPPPARQDARGGRLHVACICHTQKIRKTALTGKVSGDQRPRPLKMQGAPTFCVRQVHGAPVSPPGRQGPTHLIDVTGHRGNELGLVDVAVCPPQFNELPLGRGPQPGAVSALWGREAAG